MTDETANETTTTAQCATESVQPAEAEESTSKRRNHHEPHGGSRLWDRARGAFFALPRGLHIVMLIVFMILGFALATQVRAQRSDPLEGLSEQDLVTVLDELSTQEQNLRNWRICKVLLAKRKRVSKPRRRRPHRRKLEREQ